MSDQMKEDQSPVRKRAFENLEIGGAQYRTLLTAKFKKRKNWERPDERKVMAVIPGTIQKVMVSEGEEVRSGDALMILEAMKMRNEIRASRDGVIKNIYVKEGEQVPKSHLLLDFN